jgi:CMP-N,N'-diacetyllegionaminic acid synthase
MKILALIPARSGSKRLKDKNILDLGGKPLINWSIEQALGVASIFDVVVSTDSQKIAEISREAGASVPWLRPNNLSTDSTSTVDVAIHALNWYESQVSTVDGLLLLQPTSPFRSKETIEKAIDIFRISKQKSVVSVFSGINHLNKTFFYDNSTMFPLLNLLNFPNQSKSSENFYTINGGVYLISPLQLRSERTFLGSDLIPLPVHSPMESIDIDTEWDLRLARTIIDSI